MTAYETQAQLDLMPTAASPTAEKILVRKRDGHLEPFNEARIQLALESAYKDELSLAKDQPLPADVAHQRGVHGAGGGAKGARPRRRRQANWRSS